MLQVYDIVLSNLVIMLRTNYYKICDPLNNF